MADTFTTHARLRLIENGGQIDAWNSEFNDTLDLIEEMLYGVETITITGDYTLATIGDDLSSESRCRAYVLIGSPTDPFDFIVPAGIIRPLLVLNQTAEVATVKFAAGAPDVVEIQPGQMQNIVAAAGSGTYETSGVDQLENAATVDYLDWKPSSEYWQVGVAAQPRAAIANAFRGVTVSGGQLTLDYRDGLDLLVPLTQSITAWSLSPTPPVGYLHPITMRFQQVAGARTIAWTSMFVFPNGARPVMTSAFGSIDILRGYLTAGPVLYVSSYQQNFLP